MELTTDAARYERQFKKALIFSAKASVTVGGAADRSLFYTLLNCLRYSSAGFCPLFMLWYCWLWLNLLWNKKSLSGACRLAACRTAAGCR